MQFNFQNKVKSLKDISLKTIYDLSNNFVKNSHVAIVNAEEENFIEKCENSKYMQEFRDILWHPTIGRKGQGWSMFNNFENCLGGDYFQSVLFFMSRIIGGHRNDVVENAYMDIRISRLFWISFYHLYATEISLNTFVLEKNVSPIQNRNTLAFKVRLEIRSVLVPYQF